MYRWLNGPGGVFKNPLPGSTNYLNAYDQSGNLIRAPKDRTSAENHETKVENADDEELEELPEGTEDLRPSRKRSQRNESAQVDARTIPKETAEDLMPFPLNKTFRSQAVLSEELKDAIWKRVMEDGKSVRDVSAVFGVEMRRVAAVVRLKAVEKEWEKQVCFPYSGFTSPFLR